uniref:HECT domain-containing protein n=1 Tax=Sander lucioperca TaxID=283035 RepID=A0A8D0AGW4_SANLU
MYTDFTFSPHTSVGMGTKVKSNAPLFDYLANAGCLRPMRSITDRDLLVQDIGMFQVIHRVQGPFQKVFSVSCCTVRSISKGVIILTIDQQEEGPSKLEKILAFTTGASVVPPISFSPTPSVQFIHKGDDGFSTSMFTLANTCVNCIKLPLHVSYQLFKEKFDFALGNTYGFGRA